jgi:hypothetical protein
MKTKPETGKGISCQTSGHPFRKPLVFHFFSPKSAQVVDFSPFFISLSLPCFALQPCANATRAGPAVIRADTTLPGAVTIQLGGMRLRSRFLWKTRSELRAYPPAICKRRTTKCLRKKTKQARLIQLNCYGCSQFVLRSRRERHFTVHDLENQDSAHRGAFPHYTRLEPGTRPNPRRWTGDCQMRTTSDVKVPHHKLQNPKQIQL